MKLNYTTLFVVILVHAIACLTPWFFSWSGLALVIVSYYVITMMGISIGYHRLLTHGAFSCSQRLEDTFKILGCLNLQGTPLQFIAIHRAHHAHTDAEGDPHSTVQPWGSLFWAHFGWIIVEREEQTIEYMYKWAGYWCTDPLCKQLERKNYALGIYIAFAFYLFAIGTIIGGWQLGVSWVVMGVALRTVYGWHSTWAINSICHRWGYVLDKSPGHARNNWLLMIPTSGEALHANHHAHQKSARFSYRWWEIDISYLTILLMEKLGLVWGVVK